MLREPPRRPGHGLTHRMWQCPYCTSAALAKSHPEKTIRRHAGAQQCAFRFSSCRDPTSLGRLSGSIGTTGFTNGAGQWWSAWRSVPVPWLLELDARTTFQSESLYCWRAMDVGWGGNLT